MLSSNLGLGNNQLERIAAIGLINGMLQNADRLEQISGHLDLAREVGRVCENLLGLSGEFHGLAVVIAILHCCLDSRNLVAIIENLIDAGVEHVGTAVDGRKTGEALRKLTETVERINVRRLAIASHGVHIKADPVDGFGGHARFCDIEVGLEQSHRVTDEVTGIVFETELVIYILHRALRDIQAWIM